MRADRLLSIVLLLQTNRQLTSRALAERLEVSERTIHRDMEALSVSGIPVVAERGSNGGWSLLGEYRTNLTGLNEAEIQSLFVTQPPKLLADLRLEKASEGALLKLLAALPAMYRRGAEQARRRIHIDTAGWSRQEESVPLLPVLQEAIWLERKLRFTYQRGPGCHDVEREVDPLGLVAKGSAWYLVAGVAGEVRSYRISRMSQAEVLNEQCTVPAGFDLAAYWEQSTTAFKTARPNYTAQFRVSPDVFLRLRFAGRFARVGDTVEKDPDGWLRIPVGFDVEEMAVEYALSFGSKLEVIEPRSLREKVIAAAKEVVEFYEADKGRLDTGE
ncbi:MAG TPA: YafY family protein [Pyrinomonadaceae bacterium]|jgi:predicted DNA-binding transcriptional regulator YafY|nr:YafY family protein [Pyrinomonadaceae bacterium]